MKINKIVITLLGMFVCTFVQADSNKTFNVLACEPEWAALVYALGDDSFKINSATTYKQDPHHIQARPSLIAKARKADLLICSGAELEAGWLPLLLRKSNNPKILQGANGYFMSADHVELLDKRDAVDRSDGDVHGAGNPHVHFDPYRMIVIARALSQRLVSLLPERQVVIEGNLALFEANINEVLESVKQDISLIKNKNIVVQHDSWVYLFDWLNIKKVAELEPKPGLPPTSSHLTSLLKTVNKETADLIIYSSYQSNKAARWMQSKTGIKQIQLPYSVEVWNDKEALQVFYKGLVVTIRKSLNEAGK